MKWARQRDGFTHIGEKKARFIDGNSMPFQKSVGPGYIAEKKGGFLQVRTTALAQKPMPFLWLMARRAPIGYTDISQLSTQAFFARTSPQQGTRANYSLTGSGLIGNTVTPNPNQVFVGAGYILRASTGDNTAGDDGMSYCVLEKVGQTKPAALSLSADNVAGANVSFRDVMTDLRNPCLFATGWDATIGGYRFGALGYSVSFDEVPMVSRIVAYIGNTATRTMQRVVIPMPAFTPHTAPSAGSLATANWPLTTWAVGNGKLLALLTQRVFYDYSSQPGSLATPVFLRSSDHGLTWTLQPATELLPYLLRQTDPPGSVYPVGGDHWPYHQGCAVSSTFVARPIGGGHIALVVLCANDAQGSTPLVNYMQGPYQDAPDAWQHSCWKFFVSNEHGENFVNKPWPGDDWYGYDPDDARQDAYAGSHGTTPTYPHKWRLLIEWLRVAAVSTPMTAGPGTFFATVGIKAVGTPDFWVLWTVDAGETWGSTLVPGKLATIMDEGL
ncbi:MAG: hypothetical protein ABI040_10560, partial [Rhodoferax sp.]